MADLETHRLESMDRYWRAANYLTIGQITLQENPLLREPLRPEHIKPRLLGHWGTSPGLSFIWCPQVGPLEEWCQGMLAKHQTYTREHFEDMPEVRDWVWTDTWP